MFNPFIFFCLYYQESLEYFFIIIFSFWFCHGHWFWSHMDRKKSWENVSKNLKINTSDKILNSKFLYRCVARYFEYFWCYNFKRNLTCMKENTQKDVQPVMKCMYQKTPEKNVQVSPILARSCTIWMISKDIKVAKTTDDSKTINWRDAYGRTSTSCLISIEK